MKPTLPPEANSAYALLKIISDPAMAKQHLDKITEQTLFNTALRDEIREKNEEARALAEKTSADRREAESALAQLHDEMARHQADMFAKKNEMDARGAQVQVRETRLAAAESKLSADKSGADADMAKREAAMKARETEIGAREEKSKQLLAEGLALQQKWERKLSQLKAIQAG